MICCEKPEPSRKATVVLAPIPGWTAVLVTVSMVVLIALASSDPAMAYKKKTPEAEDLFNPLLGPQYAHWLVGPIYHMLSDKEVAEFLDLVSDQEAEVFISAFWEKKNAGTPVFHETPRQIFDKRAIEADKRFTEGAFPGRNSDRGMIHILYGEPDDISYSNPKNVDDPTLEVWEYSKSAAPGLDGDQPKKSFRFIKIGDRTELYSGQTIRRLPNQRRRTGF